MKFIIRNIFVFFLMFPFGNILMAQPYKTFETLKTKALFPVSGQGDACQSFADEDIRIIRVTNLNRSGEGSLAWAVAQEGARIVVFEAGGIIDHCSFTWATDENLSASGPRHDGADKTSRNITFSNCIIAEGLYRSTHSKTVHSMGTLIHDYCRNIAVVRNLFAHNNQRNPMIKPNAVAFVANNLIYNPGNAAIHASCPVSEYADCPDSLRLPQLAVAGNVMIPGANTPENMYLIKGTMIACHQDNMICRNINDPKGNKTAEIISPEVESLAVAPIRTDRYQQLEAESVARHVLLNAGARPKTRDAVDRRIIRDVVAGRGKLINSQEEVGGYPDYPPASRTLSVPDKHIEEWLGQLSDQLIK
jgi:hypothetical protein